MRPSNVLTAKGVDGLIVAPAAMHEKAHLQDALGAGRPLVLLDREVPGLDVDAALVDGKAAAKAATRLLIDAGHRRVAYVTAAARARPRYAGPSRIALTTVLGRIEGFLAASAEAGIVEPERHVRLGAKGMAAARPSWRSLTPPDRPTAVLASDSRVALEVLRAAKSLGLAGAPAAVLVTFDDADWTSAIDPAVTVVAQPTYRLGFEAARMLIERIGGTRSRPRRCVLEATLIPGKSVAAPGG